MKTLVRGLAAIGLMALLASTAGRAEEPRGVKPLPEKIEIAPGPFQPTWESLQRYGCPQWFRDAKLGLFAHWGPQSVPMIGDWYARKMYLEGSPDYKYHLEHFGHPSQFGFKDVIALWKAEKWDPDRLMGLYKKAGAHYFVSMGVHHDNFDLWNSKYHRWNAVAMGPKRDVVGEWQKAARKYGLPFGVTEHIGASYTWFQPSHGADKTGPKAGVPYDGADPRYQDLYHPLISQGEPVSLAAMVEKHWYTTDPQWPNEWFHRVQDLVDTYHPDLLFSDGGVPFGKFGRSLLAHYYNANAREHGGRLEAVYFCKGQRHIPDHEEFVAGTCVEDVERGVMTDISARPWQIDSSLADWFYNKSWKYRSATWVIHTLADVVSKNGNLLLNVVQRPDGSLDAEVEQVLGQMADWMAVNGEAIFGTRPWKRFGEGPTVVQGGHFKEVREYCAKDIRFTAKGDVLYAIVLGWPDQGKTVLETLAGGSPLVKSGPTEVVLLGCREPLHWTRTDRGLEIQLPAKKPCEHAIVLKITGLKTAP